MRSMRVWGPSTGPTARALAGRRCALWGWRKGVPGGGGGVRCCEGRLASGAPAPPAARPLGGLQGPTTHWLWVLGGAGVGTRQQPHSARSCELALRAVGAARGHPGGAPPAWVRGVRGRALSHPQLPALWAGCWGPLPTGCGCGGVRAWGPVTNPTARALACCGGCMRVPGGGASCLGVGRRGSGALPPPTARPLGGLPGPTTQWLWVRGGAGLRTRHQPQSARSCVLWGRHEGARGGRLLPGCGATGVGRSPTPDCPPSGRAAGAHYPLAEGAGGCGRGDPSPTPQRALLRAGFARCGGGIRVPRGGRLLPGCGASGVGRSPTPDCPHSERAAGAHYPLAVGAGGCGRGDPSPTPRRALLRARFAGCGGGTRAPRGGAYCLDVGRPGSNARPPPTARPLGGLLGPTTHWLLVRGGAGVETRHQPHSAGSCLLWGRHEGARGGVSCLGVGCPGSGAPPLPTARPLGGLPGPTTHWLWVRGDAGVGTRHQPHSARSCELALRAVGAA